MVDYFGAIFCFGDCVSGPGGTLGGLKLDGKWGYCQLTKSIETR
jgi:hypothetical protein